MDIRNLSDRHQNSKSRKTSPMVIRHMMLGAIAAAPERGVSFYLIRQLLSGLIPEKETALGLYHYQRRGLISVGDCGNFFPTEKLMKDRERWKTEKDRSVFDPMFRIRREPVA